MEIGKLRFSRNVESLGDLESKELRIGNFVYSLNDDSVTAEVVIVNQLIGDEIYYKECDFDGNIGLSAYGIPLTEDWCVKLGFYKQDTNVIIDEDYNNGDDIVLRNRGGIWSFIWEGKNIRNIYFIHEVQNIFYFMFGEELTLKN